MTNAICIKKLEYLKWLKSKSKRKSVPVPYRFPTGGIATFFVDEADPGIPVHNYSISIETVCKGVTAFYVAECDPIDGNKRVFIPGISPSWNISKYDRQHKIVYWHVDGTSVYFTHRMIGRLRITYPQVEFDELSQNLRMNMEVFGVPTPHRSDSSSDGGVDKNDVAVSIPDRNEYPFYMAF